MKKLKLLLTMLCAFVGVGAWAQTHVWNPTALSNGTIIALQCRDTNGGAGWYFNGEVAKSPVLNYHNLFKVVTDGSGVKLQRLWDSKYVSTATTVTMVAEGASNIATFTVTNDTPTGWTTKMADTDDTRMLRFALPGTSPAQYLNTQDKVTVPKYSTGTGGYSAWYVYTFSEEQVAALNGNPSGLKVSTDTEEHWYIVQCLRGNRYLGTAADGQAINGYQTTIPTVWKFVKRNDNSWDMVDYNGAYVSVNSGIIKAATTRPDYGWTMKSSATAGYFIITSGTYQFNQANYSPYPTLNWGSGTNTTDEGCKYRFVEAPSPADPAVQLMYIKSGWYQIKSVSGVQDATGKYLKTLDLNNAILHGNYYYDLVETESTTDLNTYCYVKRGETIQVYLPNGHNVGTGCSSTAQTPINNISVLAPNADNQTEIQLKNDANHGTNYWYIFAKDNNKLLGAGSNVTTSRFQFHPVDMSAYDVYTVALGEGITGTPTITYNKEGYTGVKQMTVGGNVFVPTGESLNAADFTSTSGSVSIDAENKKIMVNSKQIDFSELSNAKKYIIKTARGWLNASETVASRHETQSVEIAIYKYAETNHYYLYDVTHSKFLGTNDLNLTTDPTTYFEVSQWATDAKEFKLKSNGTKCLLQMNGANALSINDSWATKDAGDIWYVYEVGDFTMSEELVAKITGCETLEPTPITDLSQLSTTKLYAFRNRKYDGYLKGNTNGGRLLYQEGVKPSNSLFQWQIVKEGDNYVLRNVGTGTYITNTSSTTSADSWQTTDDAVLVYNTLTKTEADNNVYFVIRNVDYETGYTYLHINGSKVTVNWEYSSSPASHYVIEEVAECDDYAATVQTELQTDAKTALGNLITTAEAANTNVDKIGSYPKSVIDPILNVLDDAKTVYGKTDATASELIAQIRTMKPLVAEVKDANILRPTPGHFYAIRDHRYNTYVDGSLTAPSSVSGMTGKVAHTAKVDGKLKAGHIWYFDDNMKGYSFDAGFGLRQGCERAAADNAQIFTFELKNDKNALPKTFAVRVPETKNNATNNVYWYIWDSGNTKYGYVDRNGTNYSADNCQFYLEEVKELTLNVTSAKAATLNLPVACRVPAGLKVYTATSKVEKETENSLQLQLIAKEDDNTTLLPANTPVFVWGPEGTYTLDLNVEDTSSEATSSDEGNNNIFSGTTAAIAHDTTDNAMVLGLEPQTNDLGFFRTTSTSINGFRAYLSSSKVDELFPATSASVRGIKVTFTDITTAIEAAHSNISEGATCDINGRQVRNIGKGLYIVNGKKIMVK